MIESISIGHLERPWAKRTTVVLALVSGWLFLASLYPDNDLNSNYIYRHEYPHWFSAIVMVASLALLRRNARRLNSLPDTELSAKEISTRDWAYRAANATLRRTGLALLVLGILFSLVVSFGHSLTVQYVYPDFTHTVFQSATESVKAYVLGLFADDTTFTAIQLIGFITYVAYALPLGLLAWREARFVDLEALEIRETLEYQAIAKSVASRYFFRLKIFGFLVLAIPVLWVPMSNVPFPSNNGAIFFLLFGTVGYGVWVFSFGMFNQAFIIQVLERSKPEGALLQVTNSLFSQFRTASITGSIMLFLTIAIPFTLGGGSAIGYFFVFAVFGGDLILLAIHMSSFESIKQIGNAGAAEAE